MMSASIASAPGESVGMADFKILCPACTSILSSKKPIPNGKKITCPHCHKPFVAATSEPASSSDSASLEFDLGNAPAPSPPKHDTPKSRERPIHVPAHKTPSKSGGRRIALWTVIIGLVVLAGGGGAAGMYYYLQLPETSLSQKHKDKKAPDVNPEPPAKPEPKTVTAPPKKGKADGKKEAKNTKAPETAVVAQGEGDKAQQAKTDKPEAPAPAVTPAPKPKTADWKEFKSTKGGFTVQFPAKAEEFQERDEDIIYYGTRTELNGFEYEITFHRLKKDELAVPVKERYKKIADEFKNTTILNNDVEFEGVPKVPVLQLTLYKNDKKDVAVERWLVYKEHVFQIAVSGDKAKLGPDQVSRFMESFRFVADPQGDFLDLTKTTGIPPERKKK